MPNQLNNYPVMLERILLALTMNDKSPVSMVATDQAGFHVSGWKSEMERQRRVLVLKRPEGVIM